MDTPSIVANNNETETQQIKEEQHAAYRPRGSSSYDSKIVRRAFTNAGIESCWNSRIQRLWFPIKTRVFAADRLDFYATPRSGTFDRRFFFRKSPRISQVIDEARERPSIDPKIQPRVGRLIARNRFAGVIARRKPIERRNERVISQNRFSLDGKLVIFWKETRNWEYVEETHIIHMYTCMYVCDVLHQCGEALRADGAAASRQATIRTSGRRRHVTEALSSSVGSAKWKN